MIFCVPVSGECRCFVAHHLNSQISLLHYLKILKNVFFRVKGEAFTQVFFFSFFLHLKLMVVRCLGWPAGGEVFMDFFYLPAPTPMPPLLSLLCLSHATPDERTSCTNFIPPHRRRTYVGDLKETEQRESKKAFRVDFLSVVGLLLSSRGLHAFASSHQSI